MASWARCHLRWLWLEGSVRGWGQWGGKGWWGLALPTSCAVGDPGRGSAGGRCFVSGAGRPPVGSSPSTQPGGTRLPASSPVPGGHGRTASRPGGRRGGRSAAGPVWPWLPRPRQGACGTWMVMAACRICRKCRRSSTIRNQLCRSRIFRTTSRCRVSCRACRSVSFRKTWGAGWGWGVGTRRVSAAPPASPAWSVSAQATPEARETKLVCRLTRPRGAFQYTERIHGI